MVHSLGLEWPPPFFVAEFTHSSIDQSILPIPHLLEEEFHIDLLAVHLNHPGMLEHAPGGRAAGGFFLQTAQ